MKEQAQAAIDALTPFNNEALVPVTITHDELAAIRIALDALKGVANEEVLEPWQEGLPMKLRQVRRVAISFFHPQVTSKPKKTEP